MYKVNELHGVDIVHLQYMYSTGVCNKVIGLINEVRYVLFDGDEIMA